MLEIPLAAMDATLAEERYLGLSAKRAEPQLTRLLDWAAANGGAFAILWHPDRFDPLTSGGWDRLYSRVLEGVARARRQLHVRRRALVPLDLVEVAQRAP